MRQGGAKRTSLWWGGLTAWGRASFVGLGAASLLAIGLGLFIPRQVEQHMLDAQASSNRQVLASLLDTQTLRLSPNALDFTELDRFVGDAIVRGDVVRVKLWDPQGSIIYSDDRRLVGRTFPKSDELERALEGAPQSEISNLSDPENRLERDLAGRLLEFYIPVERDGRTVAVWEVYQSLDRFEQELGQVRLAVWASVGSGLAILLVFLASSFGSLFRVAQARRREAEERSRELGVLLDVSKAVSASLASRHLAEAAVTTLREAGRYRAVALVRHEAPGRTGQERILASSHDPGCASRCLLTARPGMQTHPEGCISFGVELGGESGELTLVACTPAPHEYTGEERRLLRAAGEQIRSALENAQLYETLEAAQREQRRLLGRLVSAHEDERQQIVGEIHDGLGQDLHRILFGVRGSLGASEAEMRDELRRLEGVIEASVRRLRALMQELRPPSLENVGLAASLRGLAERAEREDGLAVEIRSEGPLDPEPSMPVRIAAFRIVQEALRNVVKHAHADRAVVALTQDNGTLALSISDDGEGLPSATPEGLGMWLMRERAGAIGGSLDVRSTPAGTTIEAHLPLREPQP